MPRAQHIPDDLWRRIEESYPDWRREQYPKAGAISDARERARTALDFVERALDGKDYLLGGEFSAADVMMGFTLMAARALGVLDQAYPRLGQYLARLEARPAFTASVET